MAADETTKPGKITLDIELQDLLSIVSKSGTTAPISELSASHRIEGEDLRKAWFKHVMLNIERHDDLIEKIRRIDIVNLRSELKEELRRVEAKTEKAEDELKTYKSRVIDPINNKVITLTAKLRVWSFLAGLCGSGLMAILIYVVKEFVLKPTVGGGP